MDTQKKYENSVLFTPAKIGPLTLRNRTIRSAAFEGMAENYSPSEKLFNYHTSVAAGGIGMTTLAYASVSRSGLSFESQLWMRPEIVSGLRRITDSIHSHGAAASIQLGHCGNMTHISTAGQIPIGASTGFNLYSPTIVRGMNKKEIISVAKDYGKAVNLAREAGFDAVEIHAGHGYLISQFLSPYTNHRHDEYGGSLDNRMRFMRMCMNEVMEAAGTDIAVTVKACIHLHGSHGVVDLGNCLFGQGVTVGLCFVSQCVGSLDVFNRIVHEVISPGLAGLFVEDVRIQGLGHVQTEQAGIVGILTVELVDSIDIVVVQFCIADLVLANGQGDSITLADAAVRNGTADTDISSEHHKNGQNNHSQGGVKLQFLCFLLLGQLLFGHLCSLLSIAELLLAGCTHGKSFPLICPSGFVTQWENCG